ncbi:hypothetical protein ONS95_001203 [Cadophora gregata]|uniref:uncharacterized protein n=1 Tax=Cadophora gregata TaxID=51156 RepID=UPI0026DBF283|nr:uncharacterized protein ONS95_001203 [Cadophora gregata]KAK0129268.1 hypothetical protein ONS95_001203 [Cadophora gregata]
MVALDIVHASNARLRELGPGLVALFVGGTSGIGEFTLKAFVKHADSPRVYLIGRSESAADRIITECKGLNKDGKVDFIKADVSELAEVDRACKIIQEKEKSVNLLFQTPGNSNMRGRDESPEGLDRKQALNFWSRMRFISNLLPQLRNASTLPPHFARSVSLLGTGNSYGTIDLKDIELKNSFSAYKNAAHTIIMNDFMAEQYGAREPGITFIHTEPAIVNTGFSRELPLWARLGTKIITPLIYPFMKSADETGERQLFHATSGMYPPAKPAASASSASGVSLPTGSAVMTGANGQVGSGGYLVTWKGERAKKASLTGLDQEEVSKTIWEKTAEVFQRVEKINEERGNTSS